MNYDVTGSRTAYDGKIMKVAVDDIVYHGSGPASRNDEKSILSGRSGRRSKREVVVKEPFVIIIPVLPDGRLLLVTQFRHPFAAMTSTFPAGNIDAGEAPAAAARRELEEEAGFTGHVTPLCVLHEVPEFARSVGHVFVADRLAPVPTRREDGEATMTVAAVAPGEIRRRLLAGEQKSVTMVAAFFHYEAWAARRRGLGVAAAAAAAAAAALLLAARRRSKN